MPYLLLPFWQDAPPIPYCITDATNTCAFGGPVSIGLAKNVPPLAMSFHSPFIAISACCIFLMFLCKGCIGKFPFAHNLLKRITKLGPMCYRIGLEPCFVGKVHGPVFNALYQNNRFFAAVPLLLFARSPFAIIRSIITVVIFALKRPAQGPLAHILGKLLIIIKPFKTNLDATPSVIFKLLSLWSIAATFHGFPNRVKRWFFFEWHDYRLIQMVGKSNPVGG